MKIKNILFFVLTAVIFISSLSFAGNIGKNTYGILTENFTGASFDEADTDDLVDIYIFSDTIKIDTVYASSAAVNAPEAMKYISVYPNSAVSLGWSGYGIAFKSGTGTIQRDMQSYYNGSLKFVARSTSSAAGTMSVGIKVNGIEVRRTLTDLGLVTDGNWHQITFPLNTSSGVNLTQTNLQKTDFLFMGIYAPNVSSEVKVDIDNVRWEKQSIPTLEVKMKDRSGNYYSGDMSFDVQRGVTKWQVANQCFEVMLNDMPFSSSGPVNAWIQIYTDNTNASANPRYTGVISKDSNPSGLVDEAASDVVLSTCWRAVAREPLAENELVIFQNGSILTNTSGGGYKCYLWMQDVESIDKETEVKFDFVTSKYARIWNHGSIVKTDDKDGRGVQTEEAKFAGYSSELSDGRKPLFPLYVYVGADFSSSSKVLKDHAYSTNRLFIELIYE